MAMHVHTALFAHKICDALFQFCYISLTPCDTLSRLVAHLVQKYVTLAIDNPGIVDRARWLGNLLELQHKSLYMFFSLFTRNKGLRRHVRIVFLPK